MHQLAGALPVGDVEYLNLYFRFKDGAELIGFAAVSRHLVAFNNTAAMFFTASGSLTGTVFGLLDLSVGGEQVKLVAEVTLTLVLFADPARI